MPFPLVTQSSLLYKKCKIFRLCTALACRHQYRPVVSTPTTLASFLESLVDAIGQGLHRQLCNSVGTRATGFHSSFLQLAFLIRYGPSLLSAVVITPAKTNVGRKGFSLLYRLQFWQKLKLEDHGEYCLLTDLLSALCSAAYTA